MQRSRLRVSQPTVQPTRPPSRRRAFTLTELLIVIGVIAVLLGILLPALSGVFTSGKMVGSMSNLKQVSTWLTAYAGDNRDFVVPSQFNYTTTGGPGVEYAGKVRSGAVAIGDVNRGTWTDVLWTVYEVSPFPALDTGEPDYRYDSPDRLLYEREPTYDGNPFRSTIANTSNTKGAMPGSSEATPFGPGAAEEGDPGYFAANNFFNADAASSTFNDDIRAQGGFWSHGQITRPSDSMYVVDSKAGETIEDAPLPFLNLGGDPPIQVDFRYDDVCLMLFLDGHYDTQSPWKDLAELQQDRGVRVQKLADR